MAFKEWVCGYFIAYICWLNGGFLPEWINIEEIVFLMDINNRNINMLNLVCEAVCLLNVNCRLIVLVDGSRIIGYLEFKVFL